MLGVGLEFRGTVRVGVIIRVARSFLPIPTLKLILLYVMPELCPSNIPPVRPDCRPSTPPQAVRTLFLRPAYPPAAAGNAFLTFWGGNGG